MKLFLSAILISATSITTFAEQSTPVICTTSHSTYSARNGERLVNVSAPNELIRADGGASLQGSVSDSKEIQYYAFVRDNKATISISGQDANGGSVRVSGVISDETELKAELLGALNSGQSDIYAVSCQLRTKKIME